MWVLFISLEVRECLDSSTLSRLDPLKQAFILCPKVKHLGKCKQTFTITAVNCNFPPCPSVGRSQLVVVDEGGWGWRSFETINMYNLERVGWKPFFSWYDWWSNISLFSPINPLSDRVAFLCTAYYRVSRKQLDNDGKTKADLIFALNWNWRSE